MDERLRRIQREFLANPSPELAMDFVALQCRIDPPGYSGKKISDLKKHMANVYSRLASNLSALELKEDSPIERLIAVEAIEFFSMHSFGFVSRVRMLKGLKALGVNIPDAWKRYLKKYEPYIARDLGW